MEETKIGSLVIDLKTRVEGLEKGLETARKKLQSIEEQNKQVENSNKSLDASFIAMSTSIVASLVKIKSAIDDGVQKYNNYTNSMRALEKTAKATNNSMVEIEETIDDVNKLKLMDDSDVTAATKNLLTYGFTVKQTGEVLNVLQDAAVGNRQANYTLSEAVRVTTEGIRMENSVLSDAAGVQKNIAKMYEEHAQKIGKTTDSLTQAEKVQAVYNGIMDEAAMFTGSAAEMAQGYQGQQAQVNATNLELSRTIGESMIPALTQYSSLQLAITKGLTDFVKNHKTATSTTITFTTAILATTIAVIGAKKAITSFSTATGIANGATKALTSSLMSNPLFWGGLAIGGGLALLNAFNSKMQETIDKTNELTARSHDARELVEKFMEKKSYTEEEVNQAKNIIQQTQKDNAELQKELDKRKKIMEDLNEAIKFEEMQMNPNLQRIDSLKKDFEETSRLVEDIQNHIDNYNKRIEVLNMTLQTNSEAQEYATLTNVKATRQRLVDIAQTYADINGKKQLLEILKQGKTGTEEYSDAKSQLVKVYPELATVNENTIKSVEDTIAVEEKSAKKEWDLAQSTISNSIAKLEAIKNNDEQAQRIALATGQTVDEVKKSIDAATISLIQLSNVAVGTLAQSSTTTDFKPKRASSSRGSSSYSNKALDNYKKEIEHKKALDEISLRNELNMYEYALKHFAKTQDEKWELLEKIHSLQKEIREKTLDDYIADIQYKKAMNQISTQEEINMYRYALDNYAKTSAEKREIRQTIYELNKELAQKEKQLLDEQTKDYENYIQEQKNARGAAYDVVEQSADYDKIIEMHKKYLKQIMQDERLSLEERKQIYREELETIKNYEQQKRDLRVESIDNTVNQLTQAIKKELDEMYEKDKELIDKNLEEVEKWKNARIEAINEEYDARIEAIEKELDALDKAEQQKTRDEEDAEYNKKKKRLEELIAFEHDAVNKANYQKELDKLVAEHQKELDKRVLEDKKEALNKQKDLLKEEQDSKVDAIEKETEKRKEQYDKQLEELDKYYETQINKAQETAEKMILNMEKNQDKIINLLQKYGDAYELTGQTLGEKLLQGMGKGVEEKIYNFIQKFQDMIDANLEKKIKEWTASNYKYETGKDKPQSRTVNVTQVNHIEQNPELPSELYRKMMNVSQKLAEEFAGM